MLREAAVAALAPLAAQGVRIEVFYGEQARYLPEWFAHGQVVHNVPAAITALAARWEPSASWPTVIQRLRWMIGMYATLDEQPPLLVDLAGMALSCGGADQAAVLAHEAICYLPPTPSATRSQALRELGVALLSQGKIAAGLRLLDQAIATAAAAKAPAVGASALCQSGLYALNHGEYAVAERRFRDAVELLSSTSRRHLLALAHHSLAVALMHQGKGEAEHHATTALTLRSDLHSHLAEEDRMLLSQLRQGRREAN
jgi:ATP/maltotriose-dependent transcriptional regulator MalT